MDDRLALAKQDILAEFETHGAVATRAWLARYPDLAVELLDFIIWLDGMAPGHESVDEHWVDDQGRAEAALRAACDDAAGKPRNAVGRLADDLVVARTSRHRHPQGSASRAFKRAAVLSWTVERLHARRGSRVTRLATQKAVYLLERCLDLQLFDEHQKMQLGPYDPKARYKDAEPIAHKKQWLRSQGASLAPGPMVQEAAGYATRYLGFEEVAGRLVDLLGGLTDPELETLATIDAAALDLRRRGQDVTEDSIRGFLAEVPEWRGKLERGNFSEVCITQALQRVSRLRLDADAR